MITIHASLRIMKQWFIIPFIICSIYSFCTMAQPYTVMTYNVENLFDTTHDSLKDDTDFLPESELHWTKHRFNKKLHQIMQVITGTGNGRLPVIVGLCEIENDNVLHAMTRYEPYRQLGYEYLHYESPDKRGIDVAILYQPDFFTPLISRPVPVVLPNESRGRDLLYASGTTPDGTVLHLIQVHFPSRRTGAEASEPNRISAAHAVNEVIDSIHTIDSNAGIIIMGDFNDNPSDHVPTKVLNALPYTSHTYESDKLYNLCHNGRRYEDRTSGTYFHAGQWDMLDQIIVSGSLLNGTLPVRIYAQAQVYSPQWITHYNKNNNVNMPNRTYQGPHYTGGVSDHFPLYVTFDINL